MDNLQKILKEIDLLIEEISQSQEEPSQEILNLISEIADEIQSIQNKKREKYDIELANKLDRLIEAVADKGFSIESTNTIVEAISKIKLQPPQVKINPPKVEVNIPPIKMPSIEMPQPHIVNPDFININKPSWLKGLIDLSPIVKSIALLQITLTKISGFRFPTDPTDPISVRLSDGNKFYRALGGMTSAIGGLLTFRNSLNEAKAALVDDDGNVQIKIVETIPIDTTKTNASYTLSYNVSDELVRVDKVINGITYRKSIIPLSADTVITQSKIISSYVKQ